MSREPFDRVRRFLELLYEEKIREEFDAPILVLGDEGAGKSTFALGCAWNWKLIRGQQPTVETVLSSIVWDDTQEFKEALAEYPQRSCIPVMDAARILMKQESMMPEQIEAQQDMLDSRTQEYVAFLCYQDYGNVPDFLARRRAKYAFVVPTRGTVRGYNRDSLDEVYEDDGESWPQADLLDSFPSLEGTELWAEFKRRDRERKRARMHANDDGEDDGEDEQLTPKEIVADIKQSGVSKYISENPSNGVLSVDKDLIRYDYGVSLNTARTVKKALARDVDIEAAYDEQEEVAT